MQGPTIAQLFAFGLAASTAVDAFQVSQNVGIVRRVASFGLVAYAAPALAAPSFKLGSGTVKKRQGAKDCGGAGAEDASDDAADGAGDDADDAGDAGDDAGDDADDAADDAADDHDNAADDASDAADDASDAADDASDAADDAADDAEDDLDGDE